MDNLLQEIEAQEAEIHQETLDYLNALARVSDGDTTFEIRLCWCDPVQWWFTDGDVQYDTRHALACGAGTLTPDMDEVERIALARDLVEQVIDQVAEVTS